MSVIRVIRYSRRERKSSQLGVPDFLGYCHVVIPDRYVERMLTYHHMDFLGEPANGNLRLSVSLRQSQDGVLLVDMPGTRLECDPKRWVSVVTLTPMGSMLLVQAVHQYLSSVPEDWKPACYQQASAEAEGELSHEENNQ